MTLNHLITIFIALVHFLVIAIVLYGWAGVFGGRFLRFHRKDYFVYAFFLCGVGQVVSEALSGTCILTDIERSLRLSADPTASFAPSFLQQYFPFLPVEFINAVGICTLVALVVAGIQVLIALRRARSSSRTV
ncbi:MAG: hypothetical protein ACKOAG_05725 [Candidatus Kapaibacterium sp.]